MNTILYYLTFFSVIYLFIGIVFNVLLFFWAKLRDLDQQYDVWIKVLNSIGGLLYYLLIGSILWLPGLISTFIKPKEISQESEIPLKSKTKETFIQFLMKPYKSYLKWLYDKYQ